MVITYHPRFAPCFALFFGFSRKVTISVTMNGHYEVTNTMKDMTLSTYPKIKIIQVEKDQIMEL